MLPSLIPSAQHDFSQLFILKMFKPTRKTFYKLKVCGNTKRKSKCIGAVFPVAFAHIASVSHFDNSQNISNVFIMFVMVICDQQLQLTESSDDQHFQQLSLFNEGMYPDFFDRAAAHCRLLQSIIITFICTGKTKSSFDSLCGGLDLSTQNL